MTEAGTANEAGAIPKGRMVEKLVYGAGALAIGGILILLWMTANQRAEGRQVDLPVLAELPSWELTEKSGQRLGSDALAGTVYVADFIFTTCANQCLHMGSEMQQLQVELPRRADLKLVSFTVDPETDTPEVLRSYADSLKAEDGRWLFFTGEKKALYELSVDGFKFAVREPDGALPEFLHSGKLALVDQQGRVRGVYDHDDPEDMHLLRRDVRALLP